MSSIRKKRFDVGFELDKDSYYFLCAAGVGDTMLICGFLGDLERKWQGPIHLIIKRSHQFLMKMYAITNYTTVDLSTIELEELRHLSDKCKLPRRGCIYVAHPFVHTELNSFFEPIRDQYSTKRFVPWFLEFLQLPADTRFNVPRFLPVMSEELLRKCRQIAPIEKLILFSPEATSTIQIPDIFWVHLAKRLKQDGFSVISNVINRERCISGTHYLDLPMEDAIALGYSCKGVYSLRSGFCDALYLIGNRLHVFYPSYSSLFIYSLKEMFDQPDIDEQLVLSDNY